MKALTLNYIQGNNILKFGRQSHNEDLMCILTKLRPNVCNTALTKNHQFLFSSEFKPDNRTKFFQFFTCLKTFISIFNKKEYKVTELVVINAQLDEYTKNH